jgi:HEAT repeat protein
MTCRLITGLTVILPFVLPPSLPLTDEPDPEIVYAEQVLKDAKLPTDGPELLAYIRSKTLSDADRERLAAAVRRMGDESFEVRQQASKDLVVAGRPALPLLKRALNDADLEIARRAERCIDEIERSPVSGHLAAAARLVGELRPDGAAEVLLAYLPTADEDYVVDAVIAAVDRVGLRDGKPLPVVVAALGDRHPLRRAAAAHAVARSAGEEDRGRAAPLLRDSDPRVRYEAATGLVYAGDRAAIPALTALLTDAPVELAWQAEDILCRLAGDSLPAASLGAGVGDDRRKSRDAWEAWWKEQGDKVDLAKLTREEPLRHLTLVCEYDGASGGGRVAEYGRDGKLRWEVAGLRGPNDAQLLPGGRVLVAERNGNRVSERDRSGKEIWHHALRDSPIACQRLPNGNTLIATFSELLEVSPKGAEVHSHKHPHGFRHALRTRNGHVIYITAQGHVVELDAGWKEVRSVTPATHAQGAGYWASVEPLPGGRFLLALGGAGKVIEIDGSGKVVWECSQPQAVFATRLRNGHTLISSFQNKCLVEVDRDGKEVGKQTLQGRPFVVRRY